MEYLDDALLIRPCDVGLCVDEKSYLREMKRLKVERPSVWITGGKAATVHLFDNSGNGRELIIVCIDMVEMEKEEPIVVACVLVHEAVHIFDSICEAWGEKHPSSEFKAYSIQRLSQQLMRTYARKIGVQ